MKNDSQTPKQQALLLQQELTKVRHPLLSTKGFFTENAQELQRLAEEEGANIAILTEYDVSGVVIAKKVPEVTRIGIDENTLKQLGTEDRQSMLEEEYIPNPKHLTHIKINISGYTRLDLEYLSRKRIELFYLYESSQILWTFMINDICFININILIKRQ